MGAQLTPEALDDAEAAGNHPLSEEDQLVRRSLRYAFVLAWIVAALLPGGLPAQQQGSGHPRVVESLRLLDAWLEAEQAYEMLPGISIAIASDDGLVWAKGYGHADVEQRVPASPTTRYSGCSIAKLFTATAIMQLRDAGKLRLEDSIEEYLDWLRLRPSEGSAISIANLLTHSSGIVRDLPGAYWTGPAYPFPSHDAIVRSGGPEWIHAPPGARYEYSNVGMTLAGDIVTRVSGVPYEEYVRQHIFTPLGMRSSSIAPTDPGEQPDLAQGYTLLQRDGTRQRVPSYQVRALAPVAGLVSTVEDLARFASWQLRVLAGRQEGVLQRTSLAAMHRIQFMPADSWTTAGYGYQIWRENDRTFVGHAGTCPGFQGQILLRPQDRIATVVMINAQGVSPNRYTQRAYDIMAPALRAARATAATGSQDTAATATLEQLAGLYRRPLGSEILVVPWQGSLAVVGLPTANPLSSLETFDPIGNGRFRRSGARPDGAEIIEFKTDADGLRLWRGHQFWVHTR